MQLQYQRYRHVFCQIYGHVSVVISRGDQVDDRFVAELPDSVSHWLTEASSAHRD